MKGLCYEEAQSTAEGMCLLWHEELEVTILNKNSYMIHVNIGHEVLPTKWLLTCVYGTPYYASKKVFWDELKRLVDVIIEPCALIGNFNEVLNEQEKKEGRHVASSSRKFIEKFIEHSVA